MPAGLELAKAYVRVRADSGQLGGDLNNVRQEVTGQLQAMTADIMRSVMGMLAAYSGAAFQQMGLRQAAAFEQTQIAFTTMLGSAKETEDVLARLTEFAALTPFEMPGILQAARGLIQFGERGDDMMVTLKALGNAASGTSSDFGMIALIYNQIRGVGKLLTQDFRQLSTRGILSLQDLADYFKVTTEEAQTMLSKGMVSFEDVRKIFISLGEEGGRFANMMEKQAKSYTGLLSTLSDAIGITARTAVTPFMEKLKVLLGVKIQLLERIRALVQAMPNLASNVLMVNASLVTITATLYSLMVAARLLGITIKKTLIATGIGAVIVLLGTMAAVVITILEKVYSWALKQKEVQEALTRAAKRFQEAWGNIRESAAKLYETFRMLLYWALKPFGVELAMIPKAFAGLVALAIDKVSELVQWLSRAVRVIAQTPILFATRILMIIESAWATIKEVITNAILLPWKLLKATFFGIMGAIGVAIKKLGTLLVATFASAWEGVKTFFTNILKALEIMASTLPKIFGNMGRAMASELIQNMPEKLRGWLGLETPGAVGPSISQIMGDAKRQLGALDWDIGSIMSKKFEEKGGKAAMQNWGKELWEAFKKPFADTDWSLLGPAASRLKYWLTETVQDFRRRMAGIALGQEIGERLGQGSNWLMKQFMRARDMLKKKVGEEEETPIAFSIGAGRTGFADLGRKIQDELLKTEDPAKETAKNTAKVPPLLESLLKAVKEPLKSVVGLGAPGGI